MNKIKILFFSFIILISCKENSKSYNDNSTESSVENILTNEDETNYDENSDEYSDGTYCAEVEYYNPNTGTRSTYELDVEVEDGYLVQIDWPNGGWLDETHFSSEDISSGECSFTSDRGYEYTVTLGKKGGGCYGGNSLQSQVNEDTENTTCPNCGDEKDEYDDYCYSCQRKIDDEQERQKHRNEEEEY